MSETLVKRVTETSPSVVFEPMMPALQSAISFQLRHARRQDREELAAAAMAAAFVMCVRLCERGRPHAIFVSPLARWGVRQVLADRSVGNRMNSRDVSSRACRLRNGVLHSSLVKQHPETGEWGETLVEDRSATPAEIAIARLDFAAWLESLAPQKRAMAERLATGESTLEAARHFEISPGRISQVRRELEADWQCFQSEDD